jgi:hypothetical protein
MRLKMVLGRSWYAKGEIDGCNVWPFHKIPLSNQFALNLSVKKFAHSHVEFGVLRAVEGTCCFLSRNEHQPENPSRKPGTYAGTFRL